MIRDFTYISDTIETLVRILKKIPTSNPSFEKLKPDPSSSWAPHKIFNVGNSNPTSLMDFISAIENSLGKKSKKVFLPLQPGDVPATSADTSLIENWINFKPHTSVERGIENFVHWYLSYYKISLSK